MKLPRPEKSELVALRKEEKLTRKEIAEKYGVSVETVKRWVRFYKIQRRKKYEVNMKGQTNPPQLNKIELAKRILGSRMESTKMFWKLDGKPCNTEDLLRAAGIPTE